MSDSLLGDALGAYVTLAVVDRIVSDRPRYSRRRKLKGRVREMSLFGY